MALSTEEALEFLRRHQPMPSDHDITPDTADSFAAILRHFEQHPDSRCLPLLIRSVSSDTGLGMYEHIGFVLMAHNKNDVVPLLRDGLLHGSDGVKFRCCWWATDVNAWELETEIAGLVEHSDDDVRSAAESFIELKRELA